jgi:HAD superfamily phosphoserine phosphatase-like hydrolase
MNLALFDFDHTITSADTYSRFLYSIARPGEARRGKLMLAPWLIGYRIGMVSATALRARATRFAFHGRSRHEIADCGERYAREVLPGLLRPEMMRRIAWHQDRGDRVVVVSGSLDSYLQPWCSQFTSVLLSARLRPMQSSIFLSWRSSGKSHAKMATKEFLTPLPVTFVVNIANDLNVSRKWRAWGTL